MKHEIILYTYELRIVAVLLLFLCVYMTFKKSGVLEKYDTFVICQRELMKMGVS